MVESFGRLLLMRLLLGFLGGLLTATLIVALMARQGIAPFEPEPSSPVLPQARISVGWDVSDGAIVLKTSLTLGFPKDGIPRNICHNQTE